MGWVPVSEHGINPAAPLHTVPAMSVVGSTLYAAGHSSDSGTELWKAAVAAERWTPVVSIPTLHRPSTMVLHAGALYIGGRDGTARSMLVRITLDDPPGIRVLPLPVAGIEVCSLLSMDSYLFLTIGGRIWRTTAADVGGAWEEIGSEIGSDMGRERPHVDNIFLARGWTAGEILVGTGRDPPGAPGSPGTGAEVWRSNDYGSRWERLAEDGFGRPNTGAVPALAVFRGVWGGVHIYASAMNHPDGNTVYKHDASGRWEPMPYAPPPPMLPMPAPIRSMASFGGRLFIGEGNSTFGAVLFYTISGFGWRRDRSGLSGSAGEVPLFLHAVTPARADRQFLYVAVEYVSKSGAKIWRRDLDFRDFVLTMLYRALRVVLPSERLARIVLPSARPGPPNGI
jgi:hypothetical protein